MWGEEVQIERQALHYVHKLVFRELHLSKDEITRHLSAPDLCCGVGASVCILAEIITAGL
jgi:hypothetical protein